MTMKRVHNSYVVLFGLVCSTLVLLGIKYPCAHVELAMTRQLIYWHVQI